jgi:hypothetical protein
MEKRISSRTISDPKVSKAAGFIHTYMRSLLGDPAQHCKVAQVASSAICAKSLIISTGFRTTRRLGADRHQ